MGTSSSRQLNSLFAENLKEAQAAENVENQELADDIGVSLRLIQLYRAGTVRPRDATLIKLANRLNRSVGWFFTENGVEAA